MTADCYGRAYALGYQRTVRFLMSRGVEREKADDVAQSAWTKGWERIHQLRDTALLLRWVNSIALNCYRREVRDTPQFQALPELRCTSNVNLAALDLDQIVRRCRPANRALLEEYAAGATTPEIARDRGVTQASVRLRLMRATREARGLICEAAA